VAFRRDDPSACNLRLLEAHATPMEISGASEEKGLAGRQI